MFSFIFTEVLVALIIIFLLLILSGVWPPDSPWAPWWQMPDDVIKKMCHLAKISSKDTICDLGCGTGKALLYAAKKCGAKGVGIEIDPIRYWLARWNVWKTNRHIAYSLWHIDNGNTSSLREVKQNTLDITFLKKNFFDVDISPATIIFVYLVPAALKRLTPKFLKELKPETKFLSYVYPMPEALFKGKLKLIKHDIKMRIYYYKLI